MWPVHLQVFLNFLNFQCVIEIEIVFACLSQIRKEWITWNIFFLLKISVFVTAFFANLFTKKTSCHTWFKSVEFLGSAAKSKKSNEDWIEEANNKTSLYRLTCAQEEWRVRDHWDLRHQKQFRNAALKLILTQILDQKTFHFALQTSDNWCDHVPELLN